MKAVLHKTLPFVVSLLVLLTGQGVAASRGMETAVGQMILCTGDGPVVVYTDADGQPTQPPHFCPDYAMTLLGAVLDVSSRVPEAPKPDQVQPVRTCRNLIAAPIPHHPARAPPVVF
jgi:hypothetical protein